MVKNNQSQAATAKKRTAVKKAVPQKTTTVKKKKSPPKWATTKTSLFLAMIMVIVYTVINLVYGFINASTGTVFYFDSTLTSEWFGFWRWVVTGSGTVSIFKLITASKTTVATGKKAKLPNLDIAPKEEDE